MKTRSYHHVVITCSLNNVPFKGIELLLSAKVLKKKVVSRLTVLGQCCLASGFDCAPVELRVGRPASVLIGQ